MGRFRELAVVFHRHWTDSDVEHPFLLPGQRWDSLGSEAAPLLSRLFQEQLDAHVPVLLFEFAGALMELLPLDRAEGVEDWESALEQFFAPSTYTFSVPIGFASPAAGDAMGPLCDIGGRHGLRLRCDPTGEDTGALLCTLEGEVREQHHDVLVPFLAAKIAEEVVGALVVVGLADLRGAAPEPLESPGEVLLKQLSEADEEPLTGKVESPLSAVWAKFTVTGQYHATVVHVGEAPKASVETYTKEFPLGWLQTGDVSRCRIDVFGDLNQIDRAVVGKRGLNELIKDRLRLAAKPFLSGGEADEHKMRLRTAARFLRKAVFAESAGESVLFLATCLEGLLLRGAKDDISARLSEGVAYFVARTHAERSEIAKAVKSLYGRRSDYIHTGRGGYVSELGSYVDLARRVLRKELLQLT